MDRLGGGVITLLDHVTLVGDAAQSFNTPWVGFPAEHNAAQLVAVVHSRISTSTVTLQLQSTWDSNATSDTGTSIATGTSAAPSIVAISSGLGPLVRLNILFPAGSTSVCVSVFLTPKVS